MKADTLTTPTDGYVAAVDLGSNSFRMLIAQVVNTPSGMQLRPIDTLRESVRIAAGLTDKKLLGHEAYERGIAAIGRFGERLRGFDLAQVRVLMQEEYLHRRGGKAWMGGWVLPWPGPRFRP